MKRPSLKKISRQKPMNMTMTSALFSTKDLQEPKLPPLQNTMRRTTAKLDALKKPKQHIQTERTTMQSEMFKSFYHIMEQPLMRPSEYVREIEQLKLGGSELQLEKYQVNLKDNLQKNMAKIESLNTLVKEWNKILKKGLAYLTSQKSNSPNLIQEVSFWRILSRKFDELQYQFKIIYNEKDKQFVILSKNILKAEPQLNSSCEEFVKLKNQVALVIPELKKLHMSLEDLVTGNIQRFMENTHIVTSIEYLKRILLGFQNIAEGCELIRSRIPTVIDKINQAMIKKLIAAPLYPRFLANISSLKENYMIIDKALSFYSNLIGAMEELELCQLNGTMVKAEYTRDVLVNLLQILGYFEFLYKNKEVMEFSKLFSQQFDYVIYDEDNWKQWKEYMVKVEESMERKKYQP